MKLLNPLQEVLRQVTDADTGAPNGDEIQISLDRDGKAVRGLARMLARGGRDYLVRTDHEIEIKVDASVRDFDHNASVDVSFRCRVAICSTTDSQVSAETVARAFWHREHAPWEVFKQIVRKACDQWWRQHGASQGLPLKVALYRGRQDLAASVAQSLAGNGLQAAAIAEIDDNWDTPPLELADLAFRVRLSDYVDREFDLRLDLSLEVVPVSGKPDPRHPRTHAEWSDRTIECARKTMQDSVALACYFHDRADLEARLKAAIDSGMAPFGRRCKWLVARTEKPTYKLQEPLDVRFTWQALHGRNVEFKARLEAAVSPTGAPIYLRHGAPDMAAWFQQLLPETTRRMLLSCDYTVLTPEYTKHLERKIESELSTKAAEIGIKVEALVLQNELDEWRYLQPFDVEIPARTYDSGIADLPLRFDMSVQGSFSSLEDLKDLTFPLDKVKAEVIRVAEAAAATVARDIVMEEYLADWEKSAKKGSAVGVRERIANEVKNSLASRLKMHVVSVKPRQHDSELITYVRSFERAADITFPHVRFTPHDLDLKSVTLEVDAVIRIKSMSPSQALSLKSKNIQPSDMEKILLKWLTSLLIGTNTIKFRDALSNPNGPLRREVEVALQELAKTNYGVEIVLPHLGVQPSLLFQDTQRLIDNEGALTTVKNKLAQIAHEGEAINGDLSHEDTVTTTAREGEIAMLKALLENQAKLIQRGAADGSESLQSVQAQIQALQLRAGARAPVQPLKPSREVLANPDTAPKASAAQALPVSTGVFKSSGKDEPGASFY